ncbi:MAG: tripartite tricarboxylate transporter substrate-binding protein [Pseudolabrys sp.]
MGFFLRAPLLAVFALTAVAAPNAASAQGFPTRPITLVVPAAAGGPTDTVARLIAESMSRTLGQTVVVENVGGAGGTIAVWHVGQATAPALYDGLKYDVVNDFDHLGRITDVPMTLVSKTPFPANNVTELLAWIKSEATKASYGHAGIGSASHLCALVLLKELGVQMNGIAYRGTGPAMNDLLSGQFDIMCDQTTNTTNHINAGKIKGYAVTTKFKVSSVPQLPTLDSGAIPGFDVSAWHAMWAPKGLPKDIADKFVAALQTALKDQKVAERFASLGTEPVAPALATPDALKSHLAAEVKRWDAVIKAAGVKGN